MKWYWNAKDEQCQEFHYGGCLGSRNRFDSKQQCIKQCIYKLHNPAIIPGVCLYIRYNHDKLFRSMFIGL